MSSRYIQTVLTEEEFKQVKIAALTQNLSLKEFARKALLDKSKEVIKDER